MKQVFQLLVPGILIILLGSCQADKKAIEVIIDGNGQFPERLAGTWKSDNGVWEINLEPDGTISSAVISLGSVRIKPGEITTIPMRLGGQGIFKPGLWTLWYLQRQRELSVEITIDEFRTELGQDVIRGKTRDILTGPVSQDGSIWQAERFSYPEYIVDTKMYKNYNLPVDANDNPKESLLFKKVSE